MKANWTTLVVGMMFGVCLMLLLGAGAGLTTPASVADGPGTGLYQISSSGTVAWVINTQTGQVWVTEKRVVEPDSPLVVVEKPTWYTYGTPSEQSR